MKKINKVVLLIVIPFFIVACSISSEYVTPTDPDVSGFDNGYQDFGIDVETEQDYSRIIAYTEFESYTTDFELINIIIKNENPGKGFYFYMMPYLEKMEEGEWIRLEYDVSKRTYESNWAFCGIEGDKTSQYSTRIAIATDYLRDEPTPGDYRVVLFVGARTLYVPIKITQ